MRKPLFMVPLVFALVTGAWVLGCGHAQADSDTCGQPPKGGRYCASLPPLGGTFINNARIINLYMSTAWDSVVPRGSGLTKESIDSWTSAFLASGYFAGAAQYGTGMPTFGGSFNGSGACMPFGAFPPPAVTSSTAKAFVSCNASRLGFGNTKNLVVNLFITPVFNIVDQGSGQTCSSGNPIAGYHDVTLDASQIPFTVIPTSSLCNANFGSVTNTISHEDIEVLTDPFGTLGWVHRFGVWNVPLETSVGELGDICSSVGEKKSLAAQNDQIDFFGAGLTPANVSAYWGNDQQTCVPGPGAVPVLSGAPGISEDPTMIHLAFAGSGFGTVPASVLSIPSTATSPYFRFDDDTARLFAGNSLDADGDATPVHYESWSDGAISVSLPIVGMSSCDLVFASIWNPSSAGTLTTSTTMPGPAALRFSSVPSGVFPGESLRGTLAVYDSAGNEIYTKADYSITLDGVTTQRRGFGDLQLAPLALTVNAPPDAVASNLTATVTKCDGTALATSLSIPEVPQVRSVTPDHGPANTSTAVTLDGYALLAASGYSFGLENAQNVSPQSGSSVAALAPAQGPGIVTVAPLHASGAPFYQQQQVAFTYYTPNMPLLTVTQGCKSDYVTINAWDASGKPLAGAAITVSPANANIIGTVPLQLDENGSAQVEIVPTASNGALTVAIAGAGSATVQLGGVIARCMDWRSLLNQLAHQSLQQTANGCPACVFSDVPPGAENAIVTGVAALGLMGGTEGRFYPQRAVSAADLLAATHNLAGPRTFAVYRRMFGSLSAAKANQALDFATAARYVSSALQLRAYPTAHSGRVMTRADLAKVLWQYARTQAVPSKPKI